MLHECFMIICQLTVHMLVQEASPADSPGASPSSGTLLPSHKDGALCLSGPVRVAPLKLSPLPPAYNVRAKVHPSAGCKGV